MVSPFQQFPVVTLPGSVLAQICSDAGAAARDPNKTLLDFPAEYIFDQARKLAWCAAFICLRSTASTSQRNIGLSFIMRNPQSLADERP